MLMQSEHDPDIQFDPEQIDADSVAALMALGEAAPEEIALGAEVLDVFATIEAPPTEAVVFSADALTPALEETMQALKADPDFAQAITEEGEDKVRAELMAGLQKGLEADSGADEKAVAMQTDIREFLKWEDTDGETRILMGGQMLMTVTGARRGISKKAVQTFWVVFDICSLLYAILDLPACKPAKDAVTQLLNKWSSAISNTCGRFMGAIRGMLPEFQSAREGGRLAQAVKAAVRAIGNAVVTAFKALWKMKDGAKVVKDITTAVFHAAMKSWAKALYYAGQFILGLISLIGGVSALAMKIIALVQALAALIFDSVTLYLMSKSAGATEPSAA